MLVVRCSHHPQHPAFTATHLLTRFLTHFFSVVLTHSSLTHHATQVEIEVETCDKGGTFLGTIVLPGPKPINLGNTLARLGLAKTQPFFAADRCVEGVGVCFGGQGGCEASSVLEGLKRRGGALQPTEPTIAHRHLRVCGGRGQV